MNLFSHHLKNRGFTLLEAIIAVSILGVGATFFAKMTKNQVKTNKLYESKNEEVEVVKAVRQILSTPASCLDTLQGFDYSDPNNELPWGTIPTIIRDATPNPDIVMYTADATDNTNNTFSSANIKVFSIGLQVAGKPQLPNVPAGSNGPVNLWIRILRPSATVDSGAPIASRLRDYVIPIEITRDAGTDITDCFAVGGGASITLEESAQYACQVFGGNYLLPGAGAPNFNANYGAGTGQCQGLQLRSVNNTASTPAITIVDDATITLTSDKRLKKDIHELPPILEEIDRIDTVTYKWKKNNHDGIGFIAQNIQETFPNFVYSSPRGYLTVNYNNMIPVAIKGIKDLNQNLKKLEEENKLLKDEIFILKQVLCEENDLISFCP